MVCYGQSAHLRILGVFWAVLGVSAVFYLGCFWAYFGVSGVGLDMGQIWGFYHIYGK